VRRDLWAGILLGLVTGWTILLIRRRRFFDTPVRLTVLSGSLAAVLMLQYIVFAPPILARNERRRPIAARVNSLVPTGEPLYVYRPGYLDVLFYVRQPLEYVIEPTQIDARVRFLLVRDRVYRQFQKDPALAGRFGNTLCTFPHGSGGDFRLVELQKAGDAKAME